MIANLPYKIPPLRNLYQALVAKKTECSPIVPAYTIINPVGYVVHRDQFENLKQIPEFKDITEKDFIVVDGPWEEVR